MKRTLLTVALLAATSAVQAAPWTYNGTLNDAGKPANGKYDLRVTLLNEAKTANVTSPITFNAVNVVDGSFSVDIDFGIDLNTAPVMALATEVQQGGSGFVSLGDPKQFDPKAMLGGVCWDTSGNAATTGSDFLGTTDNQAMSIRANNSRAIRIEPSAELSASNFPITHNIIAGSAANGVIAPARGATIAGGGSVGGQDPSYTTGGSNRVDDHYGTIGGGFDNQAGSISFTATDGAFATVGGGRANSATDMSSTVSGGAENIASGDRSTVGGGGGNSASGNIGTVGGGLLNIASGLLSTVSGGQVNHAAGKFSTVSGGFNNCAGGDHSWVGGDSARTRVGTESFDGTCAASSGDADGDEGTFVWADQSSNGPFISTQPNQFIVRAANGVGINTATTGAAELVVQAVDAGATITLRSVSDNSVSFTANDTSGILGISTNPTGSFDRIQVFGPGGGIARLTNGGTWANASSRSYKENFTPVNGTDVLSRLVALPIMTWDYIGSTEGLHMGPVAEDFKETFGLAGDGKSISTVDADGIALAAIQGLNAKLESENEALRARLDAIEARLQ